jgi:hypothetical protein
MPYDPGVVNRSGEILAQSRLSGGMAALGGISQGIQTYQKNKLQNQILSSENEALIAGLQQLQQMKVPGVAQMAPPGMDSLIKRHLEGGGLNLNDSMKLNAMLGTTLKTAKTTQDMQAQAVQRELQNQALSAKLAEGAQAVDDVRGFNQILQDITSQGKDINLENITAAASRLPKGLSPAAFDSLSQSLSRMQPKAGPSTAAQQDTEAIIKAEIAAGSLSPTDANAISKRRAELLALGGRGERQTERFQAMGPVISADGGFLGYGVFDQQTSEFGLRDPKTGKIVPLPEGAKPSTVSGMSRGMLAGPQFLKLREELGQAETALNRLSAYMSSVEDSNQGFQRLADRFSTSIKTLFDTGALKPEELARAAATGQLQSLLGANRIEMLGGGVLTENDALRIIAGLGGDVTALQNKEVVRDAIARMYNDKYRTYQRNRTDYNIQVKGGYGEQGYEQADAVDFDPRFLKSSASPKAKDDRRTQLKGLMEQIAALEAKLKGEAKD